MQLQDVFFSGESFFGCSLLSGMGDSCLQQNMSYFLGDWVCPFYANYDMPNAEPTDNIQDLFVRIRHLFKNTDLQKMFRWTWKFRNIKIHLYENSVSNLGLWECICVSCRTKYGSAFIWWWNQAEVVKAAGFTDISALNKYKLCANY